MDKFSREKRSEIMSKVRFKDSEIEVALRKGLWKRGLRYSKNSLNYFGKLDIVLKKYKTVFLWIHVFGMLVLSTIPLRLREKNFGIKRSAGIKKEILRSTNIMKKMGGKLSEYGDMK